MNESIFKYLAIFFFVIVVWSFCSEDGTSQDGSSFNVNIQTVTPASDGLNLKAVGALLKKAKNAEELEKLLNSPTEGVNNLDLNEDGKVDYINVTEYGSEKVKGFSLTTQPAAGETQELATIEVEKVADKANVQVHGNEQVYGRNHYHHSSFGLTDMLILSYLFSNHGFYSSPWRYGSYPGHYQPYNRVSYRDYNNRASNYSRNSGFRSSNASGISSKVTSPNAGKSAKSVKAPLKNPTQSQKSFQSRSRSSSKRSGGFGRSTRSSSSRRSGGFRSGK